LYMYVVYSYRMKHIKLKARKPRFSRQDIMISTWKL